MHRNNGESIVHPRHFKHKDGKLNRINISFVHKTMVGPDENYSQDQNSDCVRKKAQAPSALELHKALKLLQE
jgi:hypothetical protein